MSALAEVFPEAFSEGLKPDPILTVSEWADAHRYLSSKSAAEPGRWRTSRTEYLREIMDALSTSSDVQEVVFMKGAQIGAPLSVETPIPTARGWSSMGEIKPGETVFDENGKPCRVTGVSEVFEDRECFEIEFSDGSIVVCDASHLWTVRNDPTGKGGKFETKPTRDLLKDFKNGKRNRYVVPVTKPLDLPAKKLPIDPYLLGVWLGDGSNSGNQITQHEDDAEEMGQYIREAGYEVVVRKPSWVKGRCMNIQVVARRKRFGEHLFGLKLIPNKHIPDGYLRASFQQRLALLQGLMDTGGHATKKGRLEFCSADPTLTADVSELILSLGLKPRVKSCFGYWGYNLFGTMYSIDFHAYSDLPVFRLLRKRARQLPRECGRSTETENRRIVDIRPTHSVPVRCIAVDSPSHLFLCGESMIPTHNTEAGNNWVGYIIDQAPGPTLMVLPNVDLAKRSSKQRIQPLIDECPTLADKVKAARERDSGNTTLLKEFDGGLLLIAGANSATGLRSMPARNAFFDEIDAYPGDVDGEGDPVALGEARTRTFSRKKIFKVSTPTIEGRSRIAENFNQTDQRYYFVPCPHCDHFQIIAWDRIRWTDDDARTAYLECAECKGKIQEHHKTAMLARGQWRATAEDTSFGKKRGYHLSSLYSPLGWLSWAQVVTEFLLSKSNPSKLRTFVNTILGETWLEKSEAPDWNRLYERREPRKIGLVATAACVLTAGADIQKDRIEVQVVAWARDRQSWSVEYLVFPGDTASEDAEPWKKLTEFLGEQWVHESSGVEMGLRMLAVDSGYNTQTVYSWGRKQPQSRVMIIKGQDSLSTIVSAPKIVDINSKGGRISRGLKLWPVGTSKAKEELYAWLRMDSPIEGEPYPAGFCHFPEYDAEFFMQLTAEQLAKKRVRGFTKYVWEKTRERNEALDTWVYARAAASAVGIDRFSTVKWQMLEEEVGAKPGVIRPVTTIVAAPLSTNAPPAPPPAAPRVKKPAAPSAQILRKKSSFWNK